MTVTCRTVGLSPVHEIEGWPVDAWVEDAIVHSVSAFADRLTVYDVLGQVIRKVTLLK